MRGGRRTPEGAPDEAPRPASPHGRIPGRQFRSSDFHQVPFQPSYLPVHALDLALLRAFVRFVVDNLGADARGRACYHRPLIPDFLSTAE